MQEILTYPEKIRLLVVNQDTTLLIAIFLTLYVLGIPGMLKNLRRERWLEWRKRKRGRRKRR